MGRAAASVSELRNQLFFLAFTGGAATAALVSQQAKLEEQITLASLALDGTTDNMAELESQTFRLAERFNQLPTEVAASIREIQQLGVESAQTREQLAQAAIGLSVLTGEELAQEEAAKSIFRLLRLTTQSQVELQRAAQASRGYASAIALAGDASAAGIAEVTRAVEVFSSLGAVAEFARADIIALSAAFTDVEEGRLTRIASSIQRLFGRELVEQGQVPRLARFMGITADEFIRMRKNNPAELLALLANRLREGRAAGEELLPTLQQLGFTNVRDQRTLAQFSAGLDKFRGLLPKVQREVMLFNQGLINQTEFQNRLQAILGTTESQFEGLLGTMQEVATIMGDMLVKGVLPLAGGLRGLARVLADNPVLTGLLVAGGATFTIGALTRGVRLLSRFGAAGLPSGIFGPLAREGAALGTGARGALGTAGLEGLLFGGGAAGARTAGSRLATAFSRRLGRAQAAALASQAAGRGGLATRGAFATGLVSERLLSRVAGSGTAARLAGTLSIVGGLIAALSLLGPVAGGVSDAIEGLIGEGTGTFSALGEFLVLILRVVELAGAAVNRIFDEIIEIAQNPIGAAILGGLVGGAVGGPLGAAAGFLGGGGLALFSEDATRLFRSATGGVESATEALQSGGGDGGGQTPTQSITIINQDKDQAKRTAQDVMARGPRNALPIKNVTRR